MASSEIRHRNVPGSGDAANEDGSDVEEKLLREGAGEEIATCSGPSSSVAAAIGQDTAGKDGDVLDAALKGLPPRWKNWVIRGIFTWLMIGGFGLIIYGGPLALMLTVS